jgi:integrase/recombinase XerD
MGTVSWTRGEGPLVPFAEGFWRELLRQGHPPGGAKHHLVLMGQLDRWLSGEGVAAAGDLTPAVAGRFLASRRARGQRRVPTLASLAPLFDYLRNQHVLPPEQIKAATGQGELLARYRRYLLNDRGLTPGTVLRYERFARRFLGGRAARTGRETGAEGLTSAEVSAWMLEAGTRLTVESAKREAADLRALLRFLYLDGILAADLGGAMPPVATWRGTRLPAAMSAADVDAVLGSCDRSTVSGRRDRAIFGAAGAPGPALG